MNAKASFAVFSVMMGCILNNIFLEYIIKLDPGAGNLITFLQFVFIALHGFIFTSKFGTVKPIIKLKNYLVLVIFFFITSVVNNWAFSFHIPVPLHMIFRAGSLIANMIMGIAILKKRYTWEKYLSVLLITVGIVICTLYSSSNVPKNCTSCGTLEKEPVLQETLTDETANNREFFWWIIGIILLTTALLLSARMGIYQETLYRQFGKHPEEALYYTHLYSLPGFLLNWNSIYDHAVVATNSEPYQLPVVNLILPLLWGYLILNVITQYICISSVYVLTTECSSLTVTLVITLRKFLSLIFSIIYFQNPFTYAHWLGTALVFGGTLLFADVPKNLKQVLFKTEKSKQKLEKNK